MLKPIVELSVGLLAAGAMIPVGLQFIAAANLTGVNETVAQVFTVVVPILAMIGLVIHFIPQI